MKNILTFGLLLFTLTLTSQNINDQSVDREYKCLIQLKNYQGEAAYVIVSIVNSKGDYIETLRVFGDGHEWYPDLKSWYAYRENKRHQPRLDGVTGATIGSGERSVVPFNIDKKYIDQGYTLQFETAVEDKNYHAKDIVVQLTSDQLKLGKYDGMEGYIRQIRLIPINK